MVGRHKEFKALSGQAGHPSAQGRILPPAVRQSPESPVVAGNVPNNTLFRLGMRDHVDEVHHHDDEVLGFNVGPVAHPLLFGP